MTSPHPAVLYPDALTVDAIRRFTTTLADAAGSVPLDSPVPTCPGWTLADLVWHMTEVQDFWTFIVASRPAGPEHYERPHRPSENRLVANLRNAVAGLTSALEWLPPDDPAWTWSNDKTVGFIVRRQIHEALTHCVDASIAARSPLPEVAPQLAADGVDEIVHVMLGDLEADASGTVLLRATDTGDDWTVGLGEGHCVVMGDALDLNLWLWGRASRSALQLAGAAAQADRIRQLLVDSTQ